ncbi:polyamine-modulated factor 1 [Plakobranchus ocellatus]|uniref:Polyamine-modulated factor 1 n=1 Tax=Plakobranchus ocellatus TaxID=259542 RepID=A0AAV4C461_9GAST|nr:polyamine-modulated factor 1 [Plakobranchus ocellatus]
MTSKECETAVTSARQSDQGENTTLSKLQDSDSSNSLKSSSQAYDKLWIATEKAVRRLTSKTKILPYIKEHFQKDYKTDSKYVLEVYKSMMDQLEMMIKDELRLQLEANDVQQLLVDLDKTVQEHAPTDKKWRPSGHPENDIKAHLQKSTSEEVQQLEKILTFLECQNKLLNDHVVKTDQKMQQSIKRLQSHHKSWEKAASMMTEETRQALIESDITLNRGITLNMTSSKCDEL